MNKKCTKCKKVKSLDDFYKDSRTKDNRYSSCKKCHLIQGSRYEKNNKEKRYKRLQKFYLKEENRLKPGARIKSRKAVKLGELLKGKCEICGEKKVDAHHTDYSKPLEVMWLCRPHHAQIHKELRDKSL